MYDCREILYGTQEKTSEKADIQGADRRVHLLSEALSLAELSTSVDLYAPLTAPETLPRVSWPPNSLWHSSAVCAAFLDSATLPTRLPSSHPGASDLHALTNLLVAPTSPEEGLDSVLSLGVLHSKFPFCEESPPPPLS